MGIPLDECAVEAGKRVGFAVTSENALTYTGILLAVLLVSLELWIRPVWRVLSALGKRRRKASEGALVTSNGQETTTTPMPLVELLKEAEQQGWRFTDNGSQHIFEFVGGLRDAGSMGVIQFSGREKQRITQMTKERALERIDPAYWQNYKIDGVTCLEVSHSTGEAQGIANDNLDTTTVADGNLTQHELFADIHLDRAQAAKWLEANPVPMIPMAEAVVKAYEETQGTLVSGMAESGPSRDVEGWYAIAITKEGDVTVFGRKPPSTVLIEIPQSDLQTFVFKNGASELIDQFDGRNKYVDLQISVSDMKRSISRIRRWNS